MIYFEDTKSVEGINVVSLLAHEIFREHFTPLIGVRQVEYMLQKFQRPDTLFCQMQEGYSYTLVYQGKEAIGYFSLLPYPDTMFLSKFYLRREFRGQGIGRLMMEEIFRRSKDKQMVYLHVNKQNTGSIAAYEKMGFSIVGSPVTEIGGGFVMDDYRMERPVSSDQ